MLNHKPKVEKFLVPIGEEKPVVVAAKEKEKVLGSKLEKPIPNPRGNPSNPKL